MTANRTDTLEKLAKLQHFATRYEVVLTLADGVKLLVGYTPRRTRAGLVAAVQFQSGAILARMPGLTDEASMTATRAAVDFGNGARAAFSGRTQREAICAGELPFVAADVVA